MIGKHDELTMFWGCLTGFDDVVELHGEGFFLVVDGTEFDAIGDTVEEAEKELKRISVDPAMRMEWDHHFMRGTELLCQVESLNEPWLDEMEGRGS